MNLPSEVNVKVQQGLQTRDLEVEAVFRGKTVEAAAARAATVLRETAAWLERVAAIDESFDPARDRLELGA